MNLLTSLAAGYTEEQVFDFITNSFPSLGQKLKSARTAGFRVKDILNQIQNLDKKSLDKLEKRISVEQGNNPLISAQRTTRKTSALPLEEKAKSSTLGALGTAAGLGLRSVIPNLISEGVSQTTDTTTPSITSSSLHPEIAQQPQTPVPGVVQPPPTVPANLAKASKAVPQVEGQVLPPPEEAEIKATNIDTLRKTGLENRIRNLVEGGMKDEDIAPTLRTMLPKDQIKRLEGLPGGFDKAVKDFTEHAKMNPRPKPEFKTVITPTGDIGTVKEEKGKVSQVDIDGKIHNKKSDELIESPLPKDELADAYDNLMAKTPESMKSGPMMWAGFDEPNKRLHVIFHGSPLYSYENISPEWVEKLRDSGFFAKTTGKTMEGEWVAGGPSRGAGLYQLIKDLQKEFGGKGKEYSGKAESVFDIVAPGREASRARQKRKKDEERKKRKKLT